MSTAPPLLATKLHAPPIVSPLVSRLRLIRDMEHGSRVGQQLTLVSAPAGFGKTTLVCDWIIRHQPDSHVVWLSLDEGDNDPVRFLAYLISALRSFDEGIGAGLLTALQSRRPPSNDTLLTTLINQIEAVYDRCLLVLDDYHLITNQFIHESLLFLLDHQPQNLHLLISTRVDPPLALARLRSRGLLNELRLEKLRFTYEESAEFLRHAVSVELEVDHIKALVSRTEGWAAGLQMAALSMRERPDIGGFIQTFTGSNRYILDYLLEEVLCRQSEYIQQFLLETSILDRLCGPLCDAVVSNNHENKIANNHLLLNMNRGAQEVLECLDASNLFVVRLDGERHWYRYHHLFSELLYKRLQQSQPDLEPVLRRRAGDWYERQGLREQAIDHYLRAGEHERGADLILELAEEILMRSEGSTYLRWVDMLPEGVLQARPLLCVYHAAALLMDGQPLQNIMACLDTAEHGVRPMTGEVAAVRSLIAAFKGNAGDSFELAHLALDHLPERGFFLRSIITWMTLL
ncbi:MAG: hypothetical protein GY759_03595 [Chloroflexi bacterium]|nr:hypothetical protein [Chloroflexota bacterium]